MRTPWITFIAAGCAAAVFGEETEKYPPRSVFDSKSIARDPFAQNDGVRAADLISIDIGANGADEAQLAKFFRVTAFSIDRLAIALINGTAVAEGESFTVQTKEGKLRLRLLKVKQNGVVLKSSGTIFNVPLTR